MFNNWNFSVWKGCHFSPTLFIYLVIQGIIYVSSGSWIFVLFCRFLSNPVVPCFGASVVQCLLLEFRVNMFVEMKPTLCCRRVVGDYSALLNL
jgi:fumarate reductase subunit C